MNSFAQLTSMMTSSSTFFLLFLVIGYPGVVMSDGPSVESCLSEALPQGLKEWTSDSSSQIIQVNWNFDKVHVGLRFTCFIVHSASAVGGLVLDSEA